MSTVGKLFGLPLESSFESVGLFKVPETDGVVSDLEALDLSVHVGLSDLLLDPGVPRESTDEDARELDVEVEDGAHGSTVFVDSRQRDVGHCVFGDFTLQQQSSRSGHISLKVPNIEFNFDECVDSMQFLKHTSKT